MGSAPYPRDRAAAHGIPVEDGAMGSIPYVQSLSPIVLSIEVASDGECSLSQCRGVWEHSQSVGRGNGECSLCSLPMAGITLLRRVGIGSASHEREVVMGTAQYVYFSSCVWSSSYMLPMESAPIGGMGRWGALPIVVSGRLGALPMSRKG
jgi:hypothetical protein